ncbi:hypothetical protein ACROYT_G014135 [Oculina patagonica]
MFICPKHRHSLGEYWKQRRPYQYPTHRVVRKPSTYHSNVECSDGKGDYETPWSGCPDWIRLSESYGLCKVFYGQWFQFETFCEYYARRKLERNAKSNYMADLTLCGCLAVGMDTNITRKKLDFCAMAR